MWSVESDLKPVKPFLKAILVVASWTLGYLSRDTSAIGVAKSIKPYNL